MRRPRFPFLIGPDEASPVSPRAGVKQDEEVTDRLSRVLKSLSLIESSLEELLEKTNQEGAWRGFFGALVPILDGIGGLREAIERHGEPEWKRGMEIVSAKLETLLGSHGLERSARVGGAFDPSLHRAAGARRAPGLPPGAIAEIVQEGWTYGGTVVRPATVIVCKEEA